MLLNKLFFYLIKENEFPDEDTNDLEQSMPGKQPGIKYNIIQIIHLYKEKRIFL